MKSNQVFKLAKSLEDGKRSIKFLKKNNLCGGHNQSIEIIEKQLEVWQDEMSSEVRHDEFVGTVVTRIEAKEDIHLMRVSTTRESNFLKASLKIIFICESSILADFYEGYFSDKFSDLTRCDNSKMRVRAYEDKVTVYLNEEGIYQQKEI